MSRSSDADGKLVKLSKERKELLTQLLGIDSKQILEQGVAESIRELLMLAAELLVNTEVIEKAGERYSRDPEKTCSRWGTQDGSVLVMEQRVPIKKQRLRTGAQGTEVELETYKELNKKEFLNEQAGAKLLSGVSTRRFPKTLEKLVRGKGIGRQTISVRGVADMTRKLQEFRERSLEGLDILVVFVDGIHLGETVYVTAVGIDSQGRKHVLGFEPGSTENSGVCRSLISNLIERGVLEESGGMLFVVDGGKGLQKAIAEVFGKRVQIQRCTVHKKRNVLDKLPKKEHEEFKQKFNAAYNKKSFKEAEKAFVALRNELILKHRGKAADSLTEGLQQILTVHRLGINGTLRRSLSTTNSIESVFSAARYYIRNVKRWQGEAQMERWIAAGLLEAEQKLRKVPGDTSLKQLKQALRNP
jgi:transposase-like protein